MPAKLGKPESPNFLNEKGELDLAKLMQANPDLLSSFINRREDTDGEGEGGGTQEVSMSFAVGLAALRDAMGLSMSYAPLNSADQVRDISLSAQANLGLEAAQGLNMDLGKSSPANPFGGSEDAPAEKKDKKTYRKKIQGQ